MAEKYTGQCACGAVKFELNLKAHPSFIANCNCRDCQRASGGAMATFFGLPQDEFVLLRGNPKPYSYVAESGKTLQRNFCPDCGSRLFTDKLESFPGTVFVMVGSLDDSDGIAPG